MTLSSARSVRVPQRERYVHKLHRDRLASIKPTVDCHTPSTVNMKHLAHRLKKKQLADGEKTRPPSSSERARVTSRRAPAEARPPTPHAARAGGGAFHDHIVHVVRGTCVLGCARSLNRRPSGFRNPRRGGLRR